MFNNLFDETLISINYEDVVEAEVISKETTEAYSDAAKSYCDPYANLDFDGVDFDSLVKKWVSRNDDNIIPRIKMKKLDDGAYRNTGNKRSKLFKAGNTKGLNMRPWVPGATS